MSIHQVASDEAIEAPEVAEAPAGAMIGLSNDRRIVFWNSGAERLFGCDASEALGRDVEAVLLRSELADESPVTHNGRSLTTRQRQVLKLIADGRSTRDIASRLGLSVKTIETHRGHLMQRLKLKSVAGLVRYAVSIGLVPTSPFSTKTTS